MAGYVTIETGGVPIKAWVKGVLFEMEAQMQLGNVARLPIMYSHVAAMPDVHMGKGATVGSVMATKDAIIPAAVGVDIGCGMTAMRTSLKAGDLPDDLAPLREAIEATVPHGGAGIKGGWKDGVPNSISKRFSASGLAERLETIEKKHPAIVGAHHVTHLGTLGSGNHFIEVCLDEEERVWVMLHSGSRGIGNRIGMYFIRKARESLIERGIGLPDKDLSWLEEGDSLFDDYVEGLLWAQEYAHHNRQIMMDRVLNVMRQSLPKFKTEKEAIDCHHNYVAREKHFGEDVWLTRKGAISAREGEMGIIPGSMGARSHIVEGKGNPESFCSCSHGAGRTMSRTAAKKTFSLADHIEATQGVECRKDKSVIDETPAAYKDIDMVMAAQADLVEIKHTLKQVICVKG